MLTDLLYRLRALFERPAVERDLDDEVRFHLERQTEKYVAAGMSPVEAARRARLAFGGVDAVKESSRESWGTALIETALRDLRYALRLLARSPAFACVAVLSLAVGIGVNTAVFQLLDSVCLRLLPVHDPGSLVEIRLEHPQNVRGSVNRPASLTNPVWEQLRNRREPFSSMFAWADDSFSLSASGEVRTAPGLWVSGEFFPALGIQPLLGRLFTPEDDRRGCGVQGAVISYGFWQSQFGGDPAVVGRTVNLANALLPVIGVTPAGFTGLDVGRTFDIALPICAEATLRSDSSRLDNGVFWWLTVMARLRPGWTLERAGAYVGSISPALFESTLPPRYPAESVKIYLGLRFTALRAGAGISGLRRQYEEPLWFLLATAALVLCIACANLANLMLARASAREGEIAVRLAIGASRRRVISQLLAESGLVALLGAGGGLLLGPVLSRSLVTLLGTQTNAVILDLRPDWRVLAFTAGLGLFACLLFGVMPALRATRNGPNEALRSEGRGMTAGRERFGLRRILVVSQMALSLVLVMGALLFLGTLRNLATARPGFQADGILIASVGFGRVNLPAAQYQPFRRDLATRLQAIPGVESVAEVTLVPLSGSARGNNAWMEGSTVRDEVGLTDVGPGYFKTMRTPLVSGREFDDRDTPGSARVAIVNEAFAREIAGSSNIVGRRFFVEATPFDPQTFYEIVGLVSNTKYMELREDFAPVVYIPIAQMPRPAATTRFLIRTSLPMDRLTPDVRRVISEANPGLRFAFQVYRTQIQESLLRERLMAALSSAFALLAALLSAVGLYGVVAFLMARRRGEIGLRMALGADRRKIVSLVLRESSLLVATGVAAGFLGTVLLFSGAKSLLFGLTPYDPLALLCAAAVLGLITLVASYLPARRASSLDPMKVLRQQ